LAARRVKKTPSPRENIVKGIEAAGELMRLQDAFADLRDKITADWMDTRPSETEVRERLYQRLHGLAAARSMLVSYVNTGKMEEAAQAVREELKGESPVV